MATSIAEVMQPARMDAMGATEEQMMPQEEQATEQEQEIYERLVLSGIQMLTEATDEIVAMFQQVEDPAESLVEVTQMIMLQLYQRAGYDVPEYILLHASLEVLENVAEFASQGMEITDKTVNQAAQALFISLIEQLDIEISEEEIKELLSGLTDEEAAGIVNQFQPQMYSGQEEQPQPQPQEQAQPQGQPQPPEQPQPQEMM